MDREKEGSSQGEEKPMLIRNLIEIIVILVLSAIGLFVYLYAKRKVSDAESSMIIRKKKDIGREATQREED